MDVPHENDILLGRGGKNNQHTGNEQLRNLARSQRERYVRCAKKEKSQISRELVSYVRLMNPPGRFLRKDESGEWVDVGDEAAREKTSQVLRDAVASPVSSLSNINVPPPLPLARSNSLPNVAGGVTEEIQLSDFQRALTASVPLIYTDNSHVSATNVITPQVTRQQNDSTGTSNDEILGELYIDPHEFDLFNGDLLGFLPMNQEK
eukprot:scaffold19345_cov63-Attheya_sp.AAC.2